MECQYTTQISKMDYWTLVNMLMNNITPDIRKQILIRLTEMNDQLIASMAMQNLVQRSRIESDRTQQMPRNYNPSNQPEQPEVDLDDISDDIEEPDELDLELTRIKKLYTKIIADKKKRRKDRQ